MSKLHYVENFITGIPRILEAYESSKRKVDFSVSENFFIIKLPNSNYGDPVNDPVNDPINDPINDTINVNEKIVLDIILRNPKIMIAEMTSQSNKSIRTINRIINFLKEKNLLKRMNSIKIVIGRCWNEIIKRWYLK